MKLGFQRRPRGASPRSLTTKITLWYLAILALCLAPYSIAVGVFFTTHMNAELDRRVHEDIELAGRALVQDESGRPAWAGGFLGKQIAEEEGGGHYVEVLSAKGEVLLAAGTMKVPSGDLPRPAAGKPVTADIPSGPVRVMCEPLTLPPDRYLIRAVVSELGVRARIRRLWTELAGLGLTILVVGGLGGWIITRRLLGPLTRLANLARRVKAEQLGNRLEVPDSSLEVDHVRDAFNDTLARLESSFEQLRRFTADASHELRTPLTALRSVGEVGLRGARSREDYTDIIGTMLEEVDRLARIADDLLALARAEGGQVQLKRERVDLCALTEEVVENLVVLAEERGQTLTATLSGPAWTVGDRMALRRAVMNLVDNAIKYSPERSRVTLLAEKNSGWLELSVTDEGPGIAPEHQRKVFERFYRVDASRSREVSGTGLGLALVKWTAEAHGGRIDLSSIPGKGSTFRLVLPLAID